MTWRRAQHSQNYVHVHVHFHAHACGPLCGTCLQIAKVRASLDIIAHVSASDLRFVGEDGVEVEASDHGARDPVVQLGS